MKMLLGLLLLFLSSSLRAEARSCVKLKVPEESSFVCVCNATHCDNAEDPVKLLHRSMYVDYVSSRDGDRLKANTGHFINLTTQTEEESPVVIQVNSSRVYQEIFGFGGAMTDSAGLNIATLSKKAQETLIKQYFGKDGIGYSFIRVPFGGTDFSTRKYSYDDTVNDTKLQHFALQYEDFHYKIPYIKMAKRLSPHPIKLISASWSAPDWMKELRNGTNGFTRLKRDYYQLYSDYYIKCLNAYKKQGLHFWGLTPQNEPFVGLGVFYGFNSMGWTPQEMRDFISENFGETLHSRGYGKLKLMILDDNRVFLPGWADVVLNDTRANKYVSGIGVHWYFDYLDPAGRKLSDAHYRFPNKFLLYTESSVIPSFDVSDSNAKAVRLGNWERAENYTSNIVQDINHWVTGWIDWNLVLNTDGGPNWVNNHVDAPVITNSRTNEFYKQPLFYALAHFSKFVPPGSRRIAYRISSDAVIECATFLRPDNNVAIVLQNRKETDVEVAILVHNQSGIKVTVKAHSIHTVVYKNSKHNHHHHYY